MDSPTRKKFEASKRKFLENMRREEAKRRRVQVLEDDDIPTTSKQRCRLGSGANTATSREAPIHEPVRSTLYRLRRETPIINSNCVRQEVPNCDTDIIILSTESSDEEAMEGISFHQATGMAVPDIPQNRHDERSEDDVDTLPRSDTSEITTEEDNDDYHFRQNLYGQEDDNRSPGVTPPQASPESQQENESSPASSTSASPRSSAHASEYEESLPTPPRRPKRKWCAWTTMTKESYETEEHHCYEWNISIKMLVQKEGYKAKKPPAQVEGEKTPRISHGNKPAITWHSPEPSERSWVTVSEWSPARRERPRAEVPSVTVTQGHDTEGPGNEQLGDILKTPPRTAVAGAQRSPLSARNSVSPSSSNSTSSSPASSVSSTTSTTSSSSGASSPSASGMSTKHHPASQSAAMCTRMESPPDISKTSAATKNFYTCENTPPRSRRLDSPPIPAPLLASPGVSRWGQVITEIPPNIQTAVEQVRSYWKRGNQLRTVVEVEGRKYRVLISKSGITKIMPDIGRPM
ncbi:uncharacterized protein LOC142242637 [Haematobia irritans]|uniref:uncharacterized protein LOC142242637 n=1 Tax=Haematobia irritans TaxID=7368 RepID=UPI003F50CE55